MLHTGRLRNVIINNWTIQKVSFRKTSLQIQSDCSIKSITPHLWCSVTVMCLKQCLTSYWLSRTPSREKEFCSSCALRCCMMLHFPEPQACSFSSAILVLYLSFSDTSIDCVLVLIMFLPLCWLPLPHTPCEEGLLACSKEINRLWWSSCWWQPCWWANAGNCHTS